MPTKEPSPVPAQQRIQTSYKQLSEAATELNAASDVLKEAVDLLNIAIRRLDLGISAWVKVAGTTNETGDWWNRKLGFAKIGRSWCIALSEERGNDSYSDQDTEERWAFNDAPRWMRVEAISKVPELLDALVQQTLDTTKKMKLRTEQVYEFSIAMNDALEATKAPKNGGANA